MVLMVKEQTLTFEILENLSTHCSLFRLAGLDEFFQFLEKGFSCIVQTHLPECGIKSSARSPLVKPCHLSLKVCKWMRLNPDSSFEKLTCFSLFCCIL